MSCCSDTGLYLASVLKVQVLYKGGGRIKKVSLVLPATEEAGAKDLISTGEKLGLISTASQGNRFNCTTQGGWIQPSSGKLCFWQQGASQRPGCERAQSTEVLACSPCRHLVWLCLPALCFQPCWDTSSWEKALPQGKEEILFVALLGNVCLAFYLYLFVYKVNYPK